jgi:hypothetical protein
MIEVRGAKAAAGVFARAIKLSLTIAVYFS